MIPKAEYVNRREKLMDKIEGDNSLILMTGNVTQYQHADTDLPFFQEPNFAYLTGINIPGSTAILNLETREFIVFAPEQTQFQLMWQLPHPTHSDLKKKYGADEVYSPEQLNEYLSKFYSDTTIHTLDGNLPSNIDYIFNSKKKKKLRETLGEVRLIKTRNEIKAIEEAINITGDALKSTMMATIHGNYTNELFGLLSLKYDSDMATHAFTPIVTQRGYILHARKNNEHLLNGKLVVIDTGAYKNDYGGDITRTFPVNGKFNPEQREIYEIVLKAQLESIEKIAPGINYREDVHNEAVRIMAEGLKDIGLFRKGQSIDAIINSKAILAFFYHGLGHQLGITTHDANEFNKSLPFELKEGMVLTCEPGLYFPPAKLKNSEDRKKLKEYVNLTMADKLINSVAGIRIEDDVLVTKNGHKVLGNEIPKSIDEIEGIVGVNPELIKQL